MWRKVADYKVVLYRFAGPIREQPTMAKIHLDLEDNDAPTVDIVFGPDNLFEYHGDPMQEDVTQPPAGWIEPVGISVSAPIRQFADMSHLLQTEQPVYVEWVPELAPNSDQLWSFSLSTSTEVVGEGMHDVSGPYFAWLNSRRRG